MNGIYSISIDATYIPLIILLADNIAGKWAK